jgi:2-oxoglutarate dehydrogenase E1 component
MLRAVGPRGYRTGGTIHFIVNNQIGFTTAPPSRAPRPIRPTSRRWSRRRSSTSTATIPKRWSTPPRSRPNSARSSGKDVVIDMFCYRRFGHNEGDEPTFTQPLMYAKIRDQQDDAQLYTEAPGRRGRDPRGRDRGMKAAFRPISTPSSRPARPTSPTRPTGSTALGRPGPAKDETKRRGETGSAEKLKDRQEAHPSPKASTSTRPSARCSSAAAR